MLECYEPKAVFKYFEEICQIPHPSHHVEEISDYLMDFAQKHRLEAYQDAFYNVIIIREASVGKEHVEPVMIQGHMDMVAVKEEGAEIDLLKDPLDLAVDGDYIYAKETSLGGDDGIAIAYGLALLADESLSLPRIELVITTEEEVGMEGATGIDLSVCKAKRMLNIDSEEEGEFVVACAGGVSVHGCLPAAKKNLKKEELLVPYEITANGFTGGHSGTEIIWHRANANKVLGNLLKNLQNEMKFHLVDISGGTKDNAIPVSSKTIILVQEKDVELLEKTLSRLSVELLEPYKKTDPAGNINWARTENIFKQYIADNKATAIIELLQSTPDGVQDMSVDLEGLVETSLNLGIMDLYEDTMNFIFSIRSSVAHKKEKLSDEICNQIRQLGGTCKIEGSYPAWEYKEDSKLREHMLNVYRKQYHKEAKVLSLHAGLECGILKEKRPELDCVSFGPDIPDIHTTKERMSISSVERVWKFLVEVLETL